MKRNTNSILKLFIDIDLDTVESVDIRVQQNDTVVDFHYPSESVVRDGTCLLMHWTENQTLMFDVGAATLDTKVHLIGTDHNPNTELVSFTFSRTLFEGQG